MTKGFRALEVATVVCMLGGVEAGAQPINPVPFVVGQQQVVIVPPAQAVGVPNSAGWYTGYSAVTSTYERPNPLGHALGGAESARETTTQIVPNNAFGQPMRGVPVYNQPNSAGWNTGYSVVTDTYERANPLAAALGGSQTVTETTTRVVPNGATGQPLNPFLPGWP